MARVISGPQVGRRALAQATLRSRPTGEESRPAHQQDHRPLDHQPDAERRPEDRRRCRPVAGPGATVGAHHRELRGGDRGQQRRVGLGDPRLEVQRETAGQQQGGRQPGRAAEQRARPPSRSSAPPPARPAATAGDRPRPWCAPGCRTASSTRPAASRCRPAAGSAAAPDIAGRRCRRSRPSARWWTQVAALVAVGRRQARQAGQEQRQGRPAAAGPSSRGETRGLRPRADGAHRVARSAAVRGLGPADQPDHAHQVPDPDQGAAPVGVFRHAEHARPVLHGRDDQRVAVAGEQRRQEAVHAIEARQVQERFARGTLSCRSPCPGVPSPTSCGARRWRCGGDCSLRNACPCGWPCGPQAAARRGLALSRPGCSISGCRPDRSGRRRPGWPPMAPRAARTPLAPRRSARSDDMANQRKAGRARRACRIAAVSSVLPSSTKTIS